LLPVDSLWFIATLLAQSAAAPLKNTSRPSILTETAHLTRVVPMPRTISPQAQAWLESLTHNRSEPETLAERRARTDEWRAQDSAEARRLYPGTGEGATIAGVRTDSIMPLLMPEPHASAHQPARGRIRLGLGIADRRRSDRQPG
jgi:hypothetical protein